MKKPTPARNARSAAVGMPWGRMVALLVVVGVGSLVFWLKQGSKPPTVISAPAPARTNLFGKPKGTVLGVKSGDTGEAATVAEVPAAGGPGEGSSPERAGKSTLEQPAAVPKELVALLAGRDLGGGGLSPEKAAMWKTNLAQLVAQGAVAVPAIREFLEKNLDYDFGPEGKSLTGYSSTRAALFDALQQIGGSEATDALLQTLRNTADPREIAQIARNLESLSPDSARQEGLAAARAALAMALRGQLQDRDMGPIFELFQTFGGPEVVAELERAASRWNYYAAIALVNLPDGAGIPSLINVLTAEGSSGGVSRLNAYQMLASVAAEHPAARAALLQQVEQGRVLANYWPYLASVLGGDSFFFQDSVFNDAAPPAGSSDTKSTHIVYGNQNFYRAPSTLATAELLTRQLDFVNELMAATTDPAAHLALQQAKDQLLKRLGQ